VDAVAPDSRNRTQPPDIELGERKTAARPEGCPPMSEQKTKGFFRAFLDFFILFSGISTASNLARTQGRKLRMRGIFLFRRRKAPDDL
jgi:hypothetical protein